MTMPEVDHAEVYYLILRFLEGGPLAQASYALRQQAEHLGLLPTTTDYLGLVRQCPYHQIPARLGDLNMASNTLPQLLAQLLRERRMRQPSYSGIDTLLAPPGPYRLLPASSPTCCNRGDSGATADKATVPGVVVPTLPPRLSALYWKAASEVEAFFEKKSMTAALGMPGSLLRRELLGSRGWSLRGQRGNQDSLTAGLMASSIRHNATFRGHRLAVYCLAIDRHGRFMVTGCDDWLVKIWSVTTGSLLHTCRGHTQVINDLAISQDGCIIASASEDKMIRIWSLKDHSMGYPLLELSGHLGGVTAVRFCTPATETPMAPNYTSSSNQTSPDGYQLLTSSYDGSLRMWTLSFSRDALNSHGEISYIVYQQGLPEAEEVASAKALTWLALDLTGSFAVVCGEEHAACIMTPVWLGDDRGTAGEGSCATSSEAAGSSTGRTAQSHQSYPYTWRMAQALSHSAPMQHAVFSPTIRGTFATASKDGVMKVWRLSSSSKGGTLHYTYWDHVPQLSSPKDPTWEESYSVTTCQEVHCTAGAVEEMSATTERLAGLSSHAASNLNNKQKKSNTNLTYCFSNVAWNCDGSLLLGTSTNLIFHVWDGFSGKKIHELKGHTDPEVPVLLGHPSNPALSMSAGYDGQLILWDVVRGSILRKFLSEDTFPVQPGHWIDPIPLVEGCFTPDGCTIAVADVSGQVHFYSTGSNGFMSNTPYDQFLSLDYAEVSTDSTGQLVEAASQLPYHLVQGQLLCNYLLNPYPQIMQQAYISRALMGLSLPFGEVRSLYGLSAVTSERGSNSARGASCAPLSTTTQFSAEVLLPGSLAYVPPTMAAAMWRASIRGASMSVQQAVATKAKEKHIQALDFMVYAYKCGSLVAMELPAAVALEATGCSACGSYEDMLYEWVPGGSGRGLEEVMQSYAADSSVYHVFPPTARTSVLPAPEHVFAYVGLGGRRRVVRTDIDKGWVEERGALRSRPIYISTTDTSSSGSLTSSSSSSEDADDASENALQLEDSLRSSVDATSSGDVSLESEDQDEVSGEETGLGPVSGRARTRRREVAGGVRQRRNLLAAGARQLQNQRQDRSGRSSRRHQQRDDGGHADSQPSAQRRSLRARRNRRWSLEEEEEEEEEQPSEHSQPQAVPRRRTRRHRVPFIQREEDNMIEGRGTETRRGTRAQQMALEGEVLAIQQGDSVRRSRRGTWSELVHDHDGIAAADADLPIRRSRRGIRSELDDDGTAVAAAADLPIRRSRRGIRSELDDDGTAVAAAANLPIRRSRRDIRSELDDDGTAVAAAADPHVSRRSNRGSSRGLLDEENDGTKAQLGLPTRRSSRSSGRGRDGEEEAAAATSYHGQRVLRSHMNWVESSQGNGMPGVSNLLDGMPGVSNLLNGMPGVSNLLDATRTGRAPALPRDSSARHIASEDPQGSSARHIASEDPQGSSAADARVATRRSSRHRIRMSYGQDYSIEEPVENNIWRRLDAQGGRGRSLEPIMGADPVIEGPGGEDGGSGEASRRRSSRRASARKRVLELQEEREDVGERPPAVQPDVEAGDLSPSGLHRSTLSPVREETMTAVEVGKKLRTPLGVRRSKQPRVSDHGEGRPYTQQLDQPVYGSGMKNEEYTAGVVELGTELRGDGEVFRQPNTDELLAASLDSQKLRHDSQALTGSPISLPQLGVKEPDHQGLPNPRPQRIRLRLPLSNNRAALQAAADINQLTATQQGEGPSCNERDCKAHAVPLVADSVAEGPAGMLVLGTGAVVDFNVTGTSLFVEPPCIAKSTCWSPEHNMIETCTEVHVPPHAPKESTAMEAHDEGPEHSFQSSDHAATDPAVPITEKGGHITADSAVPSAIPPVSSRSADPSVPNATQSSSTIPADLAAGSFLHEFYVPQSFNEDEDALNDCREATVFSEHPEAQPVRQCLTKMSKEGKLTRITDGVILVGGRGTGPGIASAALHEELNPRLMNSVQDSPKQYIIQEHWVRARSRGMEGGMNEQQPPASRQQVPDEQQPPASRQLVPDGGQGAEEEESKGRRIILSYMREDECLIGSTVPRNLRSRACRSIPVRSQGSSADVLCQKSGTVPAAGISRERRDGQVMRCEGDGRGSSWKALLRHLLPLGFSSHQNIAREVNLTDDPAALNGDPGSSVPRQKDPGSSVPRQKDPGSSVPRQKDSRLLSPDVEWQGQMHAELSSRKRAQVQQQHSRLNIGRRTAASTPGAPGVGRRTAASTPGDPGTSKHGDENNDSCKAPFSRRACKKRLGDLRARGRRKSAMVDRSRRYVNRKIRSVAVDTEDEDYVAEGEENGITSSDSSMSDSALNGSGNEEVEAASSSSLSSDREDEDLEEFMETTSLDDRKRDKKKQRSRQKRCRGTSKKDKSGKVRK
ncbi:hypothetical protein CEUSTIGMA_g4317.t1 [Chlamydomonas eustigma]|uniref:BRWD/PHIP N-terminal domain-containing protein n=1 Tax=Chlamydomonas eustigma TaxID=1157962 RepID=A0A250X1B7_9CHLO|nr:hypothetical protein CEUSTIGMA_g4317.t1 [Chlamydomonas eustigma]|eukprot:GAX76871.1 hypothetical protein CEUSTIGMA_g4317.t1 [Chlamydomonas eustigma]